MVLTTVRISFWDLGLVYIVFLSVHHFCKFGLSSSALRFKSCFRLLLSVMWPLNACSVSQQVAQNLHLFRKHCLASSCCLLMCLITGYWWYWFFWCKRTLASWWWAWEFDVQWIFNGLFLAQIKAHDLFLACVWSRSREWPPYVPWSFHFIPRWETEQWWLCTLNTKTGNCALCHYVTEDVPPFTLFIPISSSLMFAHGTWMLMFTCLRETN